MSRAAANSAKRLKTHNEKDDDKASVLSKSIESFTIDLFKCIVDCERENFVFSGLSIHMVLSMCALGAQDNTETEMLDILHLTDLKDNLSKDFKNLIPCLKDIPRIELVVANRIFVDESIVVKDTFKQTVTDVFLSDIVSVDFASQCEQSIENINDWCAEKTKNQIKQILSNGDVDFTTKMILTNVVYFQANWLNSFCASMTYNDVFYIDNNTTITVSTMHQSNTFLYKDLKELDAECISLPYRNMDYLFVIIQPKRIDGLRQLEIEMNLQNIKLNYNNTYSKTDGFKYTRIDLSLPKFRIESKIDLNEYLSKLGMAGIFTSQADFKGISEELVLDTPIHVDKIFQKVFIDVNEVGTKAGACASKILRKKGGNKRQAFKVDRPFLYRIVDRVNNVTLLSGCVIRPSYD